VKVRQIRIGEKFVLDDRGGVWEKTSDLRARNIFGARPVYGTEIDLNEDAFCFLIFEKAASEPQAKIVIYDEDKDVVLFEINDLSPDRLQFLISADALRMIPPGKRNPRKYRVTDHAYDAVVDTYYVIVIPEIVGKDADDEGQIETSQEKA
jgi:hypothetical protein